MKVFAEAAEGIDDAERRKSETALLASLSHRALVRLYDASRDPATGREFLVMELVDGRDLRDTLRLGPLGPADAARLLADLAEALHVIHERGIVHRDVKPANVLLEPAHLPSRTWNAKLADFGIARLIDDARITRTGSSWARRATSAPSRSADARRLPAADVYALGLLVLESRTGETPFPGRGRRSRRARGWCATPTSPNRSAPTGWPLLRAMTARDAVRPAVGPRRRGGGRGARPLVLDDDGRRPRRRSRSPGVAAASTMAVDRPAASDDARATEPSAPGRSRPMPRPRAHAAA